MGWFSRAPSKLQEDSEKKALPSGIWDKCPSCQATVLVSELENNLLVCTLCHFHYRFPVANRIELLLDKDSFFEWDHTLCGTDPLNFNDGRSYAERLKTMIAKTNRYDAIVTGAGLLNGQPVAFGAIDFFWMGGSMGSVVGERIKRLFGRARENNLPVILVSASGGARMHEGLFSLMQLVKTSLAVSLHKEMGLPFISVLCDPTTGGVAASFAMLGDINIAEPGATIGFAGRRVIKATINQELPKDFQTAEFCQKHGQIDIVVSRSEMKNTLDTVLQILHPNA